MSEIKELKRFIYSAMVTNSSGSQSFYIDAKNREEADERAANQESDGMYADDSEVTDLDALEYEDETTVDDFGDFPLISREQSLLAKLEAAEKERDESKAARKLSSTQWREQFDAVHLRARKSETENAELKQRAEAAEARLLVPVKFHEWQSDRAGAWYPDHCVIPLHVAIEQIRKAGFLVEGDE